MRARSRTLRCRSIKRIHGRIREGTHPAQTLLNFNEPRAQLGIGIDAVADKLHKSDRKLPHVWPRAFQHLHHQLPLDSEFTERRITQRPPCQQQTRWQRTAAECRLSSWYGVRPVNSSPNRIPNEYTSASWPYLLC